MILGAAERADWERQGYLVVRGALDPPTVAAVAAAVDEVEGWAREGGPGLHHFEQTDAGVRLARSEDLDAHQPVLSAVMRTGFLPDLLGEVLGEPVVLFKEKINFKHPGGGGFAPHQDATAYRFVDHHVSVMVPVDPATVASGCLEFAAHHPDRVLPHEAGRIDPAWVAAATWRPVEAAPGDVVVFDSYVPHRSDTNRSDRPRRVLYLTYNAASRGDHRERYYADKRAELATAGEQAASGHVRISINDDFLGRPVEPA